MPDVGDKVKLTLTVNPFDGTTTATAVATKPSGTTAPLAPSTSDGGNTWTAYVSLDEAGQWQIKWTVTGTGEGVEYDSLIATSPPDPSMVLAPLTTPERLAAELGVPMWTDPVELAQVNALLASASDEMRAATGGQPLNRMTSTVKLYAEGDGRVRLPAIPVVSVAEVLVDGAAVDYEVRDQMLYAPVRKDTPVTVTYTHGWDPIPGELVKWTCVLAAASLSGAAETGSLGMTAGINQRSEAIDDYKHSWQSFPNNPEVGMTLPSRVADRLKATYGADAGIGWVTYR